MQFGDVTVQTKQIGVAPTVPSGKHRCLIRAFVQLSDLLFLGADGIVATPDGPRRQCEAAIENAISVLAASLATSRTISTALPGIAYIPESESDEAFLRGARAVDFRMLVRSYVHEPIDLSLLPTSSLSDRMEGAGLFADALSQSDPLATYRELIRFFGRAFALPATALEKRLMQFLNSGFTYYAQDEIRSWLALRHGSVHGDGRITLHLVLHADVRPLIDRMLQAARDVLFNKTEWHSPSRERIVGWSPTSFIADSKGALQFQQHTCMSIQGQLFDSFGAYPIDLSAVLAPLPKGWWCPMGEFKSQASEVRIAAVPSEAGASITGRIALDAGD